MKKNDYLFFLNAMKKENNYKKKNMQSDAIKAQNNKHTSQFDRKHKNLVNLIKSIDPLVYIDSLVSEANHQPEADIFAWKEEVVPLHDFFVKRDPRVFLKPAPALRSLRIGDLWIVSRIVAREANQIWKFLQDLTELAEAYTGGEQESKTEALPAMPPGMPDISKIYDSFPKELMTKIQKVSDNYSSKIENGEASLENLNLGEISQELFKSLDQRDIKSMVDNFGNIFQPKQ